MTAFLVGPASVTVLCDKGPVEIPRDEFERICRTAREMWESADADEGWLHASDVARALGASVSTVRWWCQHGTLRAVKHGRRWAVRPSELARFREGCRRPTGPRPGSTARRS